LGIAYGVERREGDEVDEGVTLISILLFMFYGEVLMGRW